MADLTTTHLFNVNDLVFVITGGGSGLGESMALALDANGAAKVFILGRRLLSLRKVAEKAIRGTIVPITCDVCSKDEIEAAVKVVADQTAFVNCIVTSSGISGPLSVPPPRPSDTSIIDMQNSLWSIPFDESSKVLNTNVLGTLYSFTAFLGLLEAGNTHADSRGRKEHIQSQLISIGSLAGFSRAENVSFPYMASKAAVIHLTKSIATNFAKLAIRANCIAPGVYLSEMTEWFTDGKDFTQPASVSKDIIPLTRFGGPEDIAGAVLFLSSKAGAFVNGSALLTDGGQLAIEQGSY